MRRRSPRSASRSSWIRITSTRMATWRWSCSRRGRPTRRSRRIASSWRRLRTKRRRTKISACCWRSWDGMPTRARNWKRPLRFLRTIRKRRWRWRRCTDDWERNAQAQELMKGLTGSAGGGFGPGYFRLGVEERHRSGADRERCAAGSVRHWRTVRLGRVGPAGAVGVFVDATGGAGVGANGMGEISARRKSGGDAVSARRRGF